MSSAGGAHGWEGPSGRRADRRAVGLALAVTLAAVVGLSRPAGSGGDDLVVEEPTPPARWTVEARREVVPAGGVWLERTGAPLPDPGMHVAAWAGTSLLAWGGRGQAAAYDLVARSWRELPAAPMGARFGPSLVWTGERVLVWGGERLDGRLARDGAAVDPLSGDWDPLPRAPVALRRPVAAWTGRELLVWGARADGRSTVGAALDPEAGRWRLLPAAPVDAAGGVDGVWTGSELVVWGLDGRRRTFAAAYAPDADRWRALADPPLAQPARTAAAWTGREVVLWGRPLAGQTRPAAPPAGAALDPAAGRWRLLPAAPGYERPGTRRGLQGLRAAWTGERVIVIGGYPSSVALAYDPGADRWQALPELAGVLHPVVVWTGAFESAAGVRRNGELLVWGGYGPFGPTVGLRSWRTVGLGPTSDARWRTVP